MAHCRLLALALALIAGSPISGCEILSPEHQHPSPIEVQRIDHIREWPTSGVFYFTSAHHGLTADSQQEVEALLARIQMQGGKLIAAWFKEGATECIAPYPYPITFMIEVEPELVVQLKTEASAGAMRGFARLEEPHMTCPYHVYQFTPVQN